MTDRKRVEKIRFFLKFNKKTFSEVLGYTTPQSYTSYLNGSNNISMKMLKALIKHDPRISMDWVLKGQGQMLLSKDTSNTQKIINGDNSNHQNSNNKEIEYLQKEIEHLKQRLEDKEELIFILKKNQK